MDDRPAAHPSASDHAGATRRRVIAGTLALGVAGAGAAAVGLRGHGGASGAAADISGPPLRVRAARKGLSFGTMVSTPQLAEPAFARAVAAEADMVVPGLELKWGSMEKRRGAPDVAPAEAILRFAARHRIAVRGHTAFWYRNVPRWAVPELAGADPRPLILARVADVVGRFRGRIVEWDVVNEAVEPNDRLPGGLRRAPFGHAMGSGWIADCFHAAHQADPKARLYYNDYGLENDWAVDAARRAAVLELLADLRRRGAPVHGLGLQAHIGVGQRFSARVYRDFLAEAAAMGLELRITEFDVSDGRAPADIARRDAMVADRARALLEVAFAEPAMRGMLCWGLRDKDSHSNLNPADRRADGVPQRPLPLDDELRRKPLWSAIAAAYDGAPDRRRRG